MKNQIIKTAVTNAVLTTAYVMLVASFFIYVLPTLGPNEPKTVLAPMMMLLLLICSAGLTGWLVFGRPVLWYLDGHKQDALALLGYTLGTLFAITIAIFLIFFSLIR